MSEGDGELTLVPGSPWGDRFPLKNKISPPPPLAPFYVEF